jgi:hypothetical protein
MHRHQYQQPAAYFTNDRAINANAGSADSL